MSSTKEARAKLQHKRGLAVDVEKTDVSAGLRQLLANLLLALLEPADLDRGEFSCWLCHSC